MMTASVMHRVLCLKQLPRGGIQCITDAVIIQRENRGSAPLQGLRFSDGFRPFQSDGRCCMKLVQVLVHDTWNVASHAVLYHLRAMCCTVYRQSVVPFAGNLLTCFSAWPLPGHRP